LPPGRVTRGTQVRCQRHRSHRRRYGTAGQRGRRVPWQTQTVDPSDRRMPRPSRLVGGSPDGVILRADMTTSPTRLHAGQPVGPERVIVSQLDPRRERRPMIHDAQRAGATLRWQQSTIDRRASPDQYEACCQSEPAGRVTRPATVWAPGPRSPRSPPRRGPRSFFLRGALSYVEGVHATPHGPVEVAGSAAESHATRAYKWSGSMWGR